MRGPVPVRDCLQLLRGPGADFGGDVAISVAPHLRPEDVEEVGDLVVPVEFAEEEEVVALRFGEQEVAAVIGEIVLVAVE